MRGSALQQYWKCNEYQNINIKTIFLVENVYREYIERNKNTVENESYNFWSKN